MAVENHHYNCTYDAWNRPVKVQDDAETPATGAEYQYDGANRRIVKLIPALTKALKDEKADVREAAAQALKKIQQAQKPPAESGYNTSPYAIHALSCHHAAGVGGLGRGAIDLPAADRSFV